MEWRDAVGLRLGRGTLAKHDSILDNHVLPQWEAWPLIGIFNSYIEIENWVSELHQEHADSNSGLDRRHPLHCHEGGLQGADDPRQPLRGRPGHVG